MNNETKNKAIKTVVEIAKTLLGLAVAAAAKAAAKAAGEMLEKKVTGNSENADKNVK